MLRRGATLVGIIWCLAARAAVSEPVSYEDLLGIIDLGVGDTRESEGLAIAPDGSAVAVEWRWADRINNKIELRWFVVPLTGGKAHDVGEGGEPIAFTYEGANTGYVPPQIPLWSQDSRWIVYRAKKAGQIQLWRSRSDGSVQEPLTRNPADVERFRWAEDKRRIYFEVGLNRTEGASDAQNEAARGYLYDERFDLSRSSKAIPTSPQGQDSQTSLWVYDFDKKAERPASDRERLEYEAKNGQEAKAPTVSLLNLQADRGGGGLNPLLTLALNPGVTRAKQVICKAPFCTGRFLGSWISEDGRTAFALRWTGEFNYGPTTLFAWDVGTDRVRKILTTDNALEGCSLSRNKLICGRASTTHPTKLVSIDLANGVSETLYDPNESLIAREFGEVSSLTWLDKDGVEGFGHLVKPIGYQPGRRYPLIVVQYRSRGFLRGGVGDEYPIHIFAARGFVVLSFNRPDEWPLMARSKNWEEVKQKGWHGFWDRKRVLSVLEAGIDRLIEADLVDSQKVGITGLSDGAETLAFALIHSPDRFAAAATSGTFWNPIAYYAGGPRFQPLLQSWDFGMPECGAAMEQWKGVSIGLNAARINAPLLIQVSDAEMLSDTQTFMSLRAHHKPVEMYVFPEEFHIKVQPVHRYTIYRRNVQWFAFWLQGVEEAEPVDSAQYARWRLLRARRW